MSYSNAVQRYGKKFVQQILNLNYPSSAKYIEQICYYIKSEDMSALDVCRIFRAYDILHQRIGLTIDFRNKSFYEVSAVISANETNIKPLPNQLYLSNDKMVEIGILNSFEDAKLLDDYVSNIWCICHEKDAWDLYVNMRATFYVIRNFNYSKSSYRYVIAVVYLSEEIAFIDTKDDKVNNSMEYMSSIAEGCKVLKSKWWQNNTSQQQPTNNNHITEGLYHQYELMYKLGCIPQNLFESMICN